MSPVATHLESLTVTSGGTALRGARGTLHIDNGDQFTAMSGPDGRLSFAVEIDPQFEGWGGDLTVSADGYKTFQGRVVTGFGAHELAEVKLVRLAADTPRVGTDGRRFAAAGRRFVWRGATGFRAVELVARSQTADAERFFAAMASSGVNVVRVLTMASNLFRLAPQEGGAALPETIAIARRHGLYLEVVALADTIAYDVDLEAHVAQIGAACAAADNTFLEIANEPIHQTQRSQVGDPSFLRRLRAAVPANVPVALGAAHGKDDESRAFIGADYVTVHGDREDGEQGWRYVRHTNEQRALAEEVNKPVVNDEPRRDDLAPEKHLAMGLLCRILGLGDTFHFAGGLLAREPEGAEASAFAARRKGWDLIPADFIGAYRNIGHVGSPVAQADLATVVRIYSAVRGSDGFTLALGAAPGGPRFTWADSWPNREIVIEAPGMKLWHVTT